METCLPIELLQCCVNNWTYLTKTFLGKKSSNFLETKPYGGCFFLFLMFPLHAVVCMVKQASGWNDVD